MNHRVLPLFALALLLTVSARPALAEPGASVPEGATIGVGAGWTFPSNGDLFDLDTASLRIRLDEQITLEGLVALGVGGGAVENDVGGTVTEDQTTRYDVGLGGALRYAFASAGAAELVAIGDLRLAASGTELDPEGADNVETVSVTTATLDWGLGVNWFVSRHLALSADALNPLLRWASTRQERASTGLESTTRTFDAGLFLRPRVRVMLHVYF